jgi:uncharacterized coiled-coil DUF342 family protein
MSDKSLEQLAAELEEVRAERNKYHAQLTDFRLSALEKRTDDHETRIKPLEVGQVKANTIYTLFAGNSLLSIIALIKIFVT